MAKNAPKKVMEDSEKNLTHIVFILDKSGSMYPLTKDTIGGFNSYLDKQKEESTGEAVVSCYLFNTVTDVLYTNKDIKKAKHMTEKVYCAEGGTALYDAVGLAISQTTKNNENIKPQKTLFVIMTDGMENSSREYSHKAIKALIESKRKDAGWEFIFMGANFEAEDFAESLGMDRKLAITYECDEAGTELNFGSLHSITHVARANMDLDCLIDSEDVNDSFEKIREYRNKKNNIADDEEDGEEA